MSWEATREARAARSSGSKPSVPTTRRSTFETRNSRSSFAVHSLPTADRSRARPAVPAGAVPHPQRHADDGGAELVAVGGEHLGQQLVRVGRRLDGGEEQLVLAAEVVVHERRIDPGLGRDAADRGAVEPALGERRPGGGQDGVPGVGVAGPPAGPAASGRRSVRSSARSVAAARARASRARAGDDADVEPHRARWPWPSCPTSCRASTA